MMGGERINARDGADAVVIRGAALLEFLEAPRFLHQVRCFGPKDERHREEYIWLKDEKRAALANGDFLVARKLDERIRLLTDVLWEDEAHNRVTTAGANHLLDTYFAGSGYTAAWYAGLIGAGTGTVSITTGTNSVTGSGTSFAAGDVNAETNAICIVGAGAGGADLVATISGQSSATALTTGTNASTTVSGAAYAIAARLADTAASKSFNEVTPYSNATRPQITPWAAASGRSKSNSSAYTFTINATSRAFGIFVIDNSTKGGTTGTLYSGAMFSGGSKSVGNGDTLSVTSTLQA